MAYSSGYSPHPRVSYANAAPTGAASEAEYVEIGLAEVGDPEQVRQAVNQALPEGFHLEAAAVGVDKGWNDRLTHSLWRIGCPAADAGQLQAVLAEFLGRDRVCVAREVKAGLREFDVRGQVESLRVVDGGLEAVTKLGAPLVRPDDVVAALRAVQPDFLEGEQPLFTRLALGRWTGTEVVNLL
jgi:radical SAM-linked protein